MNTFIALVLGGIIGYVTACLVHISAQDDNRED